MSYTDLTHLPKRNHRRTYTARSPSLGSATPTIHTPILTSTRSYSINSNGAHGDNLLARATAELTRRHRAPFKSRRLTDKTPAVSFFETKQAKRDIRIQYWLFLMWIILGVVGFGALLATGILTVPKHKYCMVLDEDWSNGINPDVWQHEIQVGGFGNGEFQWTTDSSNNSYVKDGKLYITPTLTADSIGYDAVTNGYNLNLTADGTCTGTTDQQCFVFSNSTYGNASIIPPIQSARLRTVGDASIRFGRIEVTAKMPLGDWLWPAIWMLPSDNAYGEWPASGEIDIAESRGNKVLNYGSQTINTMSSALHWGPITTDDNYWRTTGIYQKLRDYFNTREYKYGLEWDEKSIWTWSSTRSRRVFRHIFSEPFWQLGEFTATSANGAQRVFIKQTSIYNPWSNATVQNAAPFDQRFYLILNLAVGGTNGWFKDQDYPDKPWSNYGLHPASDFWNARDQWLPTWGDADSRSLIVSSVKMWQQCDDR